MTIYDNLIVCCFWNTLRNPCFQHQTRTLSGHWIGALTLACLGWWVMLPSNAIAEGLPHSHVLSSAALETHATWRIDPQGTMTAEQVSAPTQASQLLPLKGPLSLGFTRQVAWVKLDLSSAKSAQWMLEVSNPVLEDVRLYERSADGAWRVRYGTLSGQSEPRELNYRRPEFKLDLTAGANSVYYLRLASRTALVTNLKLSAPETLFEASNRESFVWGLVFGAYFLVMFFYSAFWGWTHEKVHLYYVLYVGTNLGASFLTGRWNDMLGLNIDTNTHTSVLGVFICLSLWIAPLFSASFLGTHRIWPRATPLFLRACAGVSVTCIGMVLAGLYGQGVMTIQIASMFLIVITLGVSGHLAWQGNKKGQLLLLAFSLFYMGVMWRYLRNIGLIEPSWWNESVYQLGAFVHMMVMSTGIFSSYNALRRKSEQEQARANAQERQRQRQYEFLGMVSHEVRTPLTVISASADNLLLDTSVSPSTRARVDKIIRHCGKLQHLFDSYLSNERLLNGDKPISMAKVDLPALCEAAAQDIQDAYGVTVQFSTDALPSLWCNAGLIRVAVTNLLENARKHAPDKSGIELKLQRNGDMVRLSVTDHGPGIDEEDMPFIFDAYYRGKGAYTSKGSGLGLHLVKFIAEQHKGRAYACKRHSQGMQFVIEIPIGKTPSGI